MLTESARGFSLVEVLVASSLIVVAFTSLSHLAVLAARANQAAHTTTGAVLAARQKVEELRGSAAGLVPSPPGTLDANVPGFWDALDTTGQPVPVARASLLRRWSIAALRHGARGVLVVRVRVVRRMPQGANVDVVTAVTP